jgi:PAS domain S-box-containing protein
MWIALVLAAAVATEPSGGEDPWQVTRWSTDDGLPQNTVTAVAKDGDGFLWLGTQEGLVRFDGDRFVVHGDLPCPSVLALEADGAGGIAVGTEGCGAFALIHGDLRRVPDVPADARVRAVARAGDGRLWWGTDHGLVATGGGVQAERYPGDEVVAIAVRGDDTIVIATRTRLGEVGAAGVRWFESCIEPSDNLWSLAVSPGRLWVASRDHGLCSLDDDGASRRYTATDGLPSLAVKDVSVFPDGTVWVATLGGVAWFDGARFVRPATPGLDRASASITSDGDLTWIGGQLTGLSMLRPRRVRTYTTADGLAADVVWAVAQARDGTIWVGTEAGGLGELVGDRFVQRAPPTFHPDSSVGTIVLAPDGSMWVGTSVGLWHHRGDRWEQFTTAQGLPSSDARAIAFDHAGAMWVGTARGLARRDADGGFVDVTARYHLPPVAYDLVIEDRQGGGLWLGGMDVFGVLVGEQFTPRALDGRPSVSSILPTTGGVLVGTGNGVARVTADDVGWLRPDDGLPTGQVLAMAARGDQVWLTSNQGPYRIAAADLDAYFDGRAARVAPVRYGTHDGMRSPECNTAGATSLLVAHDGRVWIPTVAGLALFDLERWRAPAAAPRATIELLDDHRGDRRAPTEAAARLRLGHRDFEVGFTAPEFAAPGQLRFRYRLLGYDQTWLDVGDRRAAAYTNLGPGRYRFEVSARLPDTTWGPPAALEVVLPPHVYETGWFRWLAWLAGLAALAALVYVGTTAARRRELALRERVRERTRELDLALARTATSEANFRHLLARMPVAVALVQDGQVLYANDEALRIAGATTASELGGTPFATAPPTAPPSTTPTTAAAATAQAPATPVAGEQRFEHRGGGFALADLWYLALVHEGQPAVLCVGRDVTKRKQLETMLRTTERMASIGTLAAGVAHEINNPLTYVIGNLEMIAVELRAAPGAEPDRAALEGAVTDALDGAGRVARIVRDLRTFSRPNDDHEGPIELAPVIESTLGICKNEIRHRAELVVDLADVPPVWGNAHRLGQVVLNLLVNAAQAIAEGAVATNRVTVRTRQRPDGRVEIAVADTGCGVQPADLPRLCDPFFTTKPIGQGTGLGLSIVHGILTRFGGALEVESEVGRGSTFRAVLPAATATRPPAPSAPAAPPTRARVLVVDDEPRVTEVIRRGLARVHDVETSAHPRAVLAAIAAGQRYDCIISDLMMPELDGPELHAAVAAIDPAQADRMLFISGGTFTPRGDAFVKAMGDRYLAKPVATPDLRAAIAALLARTGR